MQFSPGRYKPQDFKFKVVGGLGMMAREVETQQLVQLLGFVPPQSPAFFAILAGVIENTSIKSKQEVLQAIQKGMQPDPQEQQARQMQMTMAAQKQQAQTAEIGSRIKYREAQTAKVAAGIETDSVKLLQNALRGGRGSQ
jgi:flagellar biosynthesis component FlhA